MKKTDNPAILPTHQEATDVKNDLDGYPLYPDKEDIYRKFKKEREVDPDDVSTFKEFKKKEQRHILDLIDDITGEDIDIPGAELDDDDELIGNEDEENNYYSLGGDDHNDLEENNDK